MLKSNWKRKLIAMLLIFTLTFSNFALVGKASAASIFDALSNDEGDTGSANVEFDATFITSEVDEETEETTVTEEGTDITADVNTDNLSIKLNIKVSNAGYLKDGKIILGNGEELNFAINSEDLESSNIQNFEDNTIELVQMNADSEIEITFPISYEGSSYVELDNISKENVIKFEGTYVDDDTEISVSKEITLNLSWEDNRETTVSSEVTKYINYSVDGENGVILQILVKADNTTESNTLPVKNSELEITVPTIDDVTPDTIKVVANSLLGTSGKTTDEIEFTEDNWSYDEESNTLKIEVKNESQLVSLQNENEVLIDETIEEVEAYYASSGTDEYIITYVYSDVSTDSLNLTSDITSTFKMYGGTTITSEEEANYELVEEIGDIVTFETVTETTSVSKGYTYLNYNNEDSKYEIEIDNKLIFNISYKDIVSGLYYEDTTDYYVTNSEETVSQNEIYYKSLKISESNFNEILGESGEVNIYDLSDNLLATLNSDTETDDDGNYNITFDSNMTGIKITTSSPQAEGNLIISTIRAYSDTSFDKSSYENFEKIQLNSVAKAIYTYVEEYVDCGTAVTEVILDNTTTNAELVIGQETLSTLATNNNVEIKIELNNDKITSDVYGDSEFTIKMPDYVESLDVTDYSIVYGEGLEISGIEGYEENGSLYLKVTVTGTQNALSSGIVSNGTNIVINANIGVDLYAPAATVAFELTYTNSEVTNYGSEVDGVGFNEARVTYSAPSGVVSVNSISGYDDNGSTLASVNQGTVVGDLAIYSSSKIATMDLIIMNNEENSISNISILGRTIFEGNTDILTGESLGTTKDASMISGITCDSEGFTVYYSTNAEADNDLNNSENGWTQEVSDWSTVKSYLIVPNDSSYELGIAEKLHFSYEFVIPENLAHNNEFYGTFATYYTNNTSVATLDEISCADLVGLSTGEGPEVEVSVSTDVKNVNEFEQFEMTTTVSNVGGVVAKNVVVTIPNPDQDSISYVETKSSNENIEISDNGDTITYTIAELAIDEVLEINTIFEVNEILGVADDDSVVLEMYAEVTADDLGTTLVSDTLSIGVNQAEMIVTIVDDLDEGRGMSKSGDTIMLNIYVQNLTSTTMENVVTSMYLDEAFTFDKGTAYVVDDEGIYDEVEIASYDSSTRTITWELDELRGTARFKVYFTVNDLTGTSLQKDIQVSATAYADGTDTYVSSDYEINVGAISLIVTQKTNTTNTYVKEGDTIEYVFVVENEGTVDADFVTLTDSVPNGLIVKSVGYSSNGEESVVQTMSESDEISTSFNVEAGTTTEVTVTAVAQTLSGAEELSVTNVGTISVSSDSITSNSITHIVESTGTTTSTVGETSTGISSSSTSSNSNLVKTYNIAGTAWIDLNGDGARDDSEELMKGVTATLVNSDTGVIKQTAITNSNGEYKFSGVTNGNYIVIFDYDTVLYTVTTYQKENVASNLNSDVITTKVEQDGEIRNAAVTDVVTISDGSESSIDIGLIYAMKFDLSLDMGITKITVQNSNGTETKTYDLATYTKTEISQKYLAGSEIYIEYTFTVTNEGEVAGYATQIVDYIPTGMNFNSSMNSDWYSGSDGNLYTNILADTEIAPGESKTFTLILSKTMTNENTGTVSNTAEIASDYNIYGISDMDSTPGNNNQSEDDFARADAILSVGTGGVYIYISVIVTTALLIGMAIFIIIIKKTSKKELEGGV